MLVLMENVLIIAVSIGLMLLALEAGRLYARRRSAEDADANDQAVAVVQGALFGLMGLFLAFTYSGAADRWERRRELVVQEANAIGTAYLRIDLLPVDAQPALRDLFRLYTDSRIAMYKALPDVRAARDQLALSAVLQQDIWSKSVAAAQASPGPAAALLMMPALNEMIDITTTRWVAALTHAPALVFGFLAVLALVSAMLAGYGMGRRRRNLLHEFAFAVTVALAVYVIVDFEFLRRGLITLEYYDRVIVEVRASMGPLTPSP